MNLPNLRRCGLTAAGLSLALLAGCASSALNTYVVAEGHHAIEVDIGNRGLSKRVSVSDIVSERRQDRLFVQAKVQNERSSGQSLEWSIEWYDQGGLLVGEPTAWKALRLGGGEIETIRETGPTSAATRMRLSIRPSSPVN